jgi:hypothetical protein
VVGGIDVLEGLSADGGQPFAADEIVIDGLRHEDPRFDFCARFIRLGRSDGDSRDEPTSQFIAVVNIKGQ